MGDRQSYTGKEKVEGLLDEFLALYQEYPPEKIRRVCMVVEQNPLLQITPPPGLIRDRENIHKLFHELPQLIKIHLATRVDEQMDQNFIEKIIKVNALRWPVFPNLITYYLENQIWGLNTALMTQEQGIKYLNKKLNEYKPGVGFVAETAFCPLCGVEELFITVLDYRLSHDNPYEHGPHNPVELIAAIPIMPQQREQQENIPSGFPDYLN